MPKSKINDQMFSDTLKLKLDTSYDRALVIFQNYNKQKIENEFGEYIIRLLISAVSKMRVSEILDILEENYLEYFHGRGRMNDYAFQETYERFIGLEDILKLL
jgi:hypothetical protein